MIIIRRPFRLQRERVVCVRIPRVICRNLGLDKDHDIMFDYEPGRKEVVLSKSSFARIERNPPWTKEQLDLLITLCETGVERSEIYRRFPRDRKSINHKMSRLGLAGKAVVPFAEQEIDLLKSLTERGLDRRQISQAMGRSKSSVYKYQEKLGLLPIASLRVKPWTEKDLGSLRAMVEMGIEVRKIAKQLDRSLQAVYMKIYRLGLGTRKKASQNRNRNVQAKEGMVT